MHLVTQLAEAISKRAAEIGLASASLERQALPAEAIVNLREAQAALDRARQALTRHLVRYPQRSNEEGK